MILTRNKDTAEAIPGGSVLGITDDGWYVVIEDGDGMDVYTNGVSKLAMTGSAYDHARRFLTTVYPNQTVSLWGRKALSWTVRNSRFGVVGAPLEECGPRAELAVTLWPTSVYIEDRDLGLAVSLPLDGIGPVRTNRTAGPGEMEQYRRWREWAREELREVDFGSGLHVRRTTGV